MLGSMPEAKADFARQKFLWFTPHASQRLRSILRSQIGQYLRTLNSAFHVNTYYLVLTTIRVPVVRLHFSLC
jgi:DNA-binding protein Fis